MESYVINALLLPLFVTWFIPNTIRDPNTGKYKGFKNSVIVSQFCFLFVLETVLVLQKFEMGWMSLFRISFTVGLTFLLALLYTMSTQKRLFGNSFRMKIEED